MTGTSKIEKLFVERGCSDLQHIYSLPQNCSGNVCDVTLDEENYGNFGKIKAKYSTKESLVKFSDARPDWNTNFGLRCIQCQSKPGALVTEKVFYLLVKPGVGTKKIWSEPGTHIFAIRVGSNRKIYQTFETVRQQNSWIILIQSTIEPSVNNINCIFWRQ